MATARAAGTSDLIRVLTDAFIRYPEQRAVDQSILRVLGRIFRPSVQPGQPFPVVGVASDPSGSVLLMLSEDDVKISEDAFDEFFGVPPVPVITKYVGEFQPCGVRMKNLAPGTSISYGASFSETGTIGCILNDVAGADYLLSCNHVIANYNHASPGDSVWIPGRAQGGNEQDSLAVLHDFEPIQFGGVIANFMDAAVARPIPGVNLFRSIPEGVGVIGGTDSNPEHNAPVLKLGIATGLTAAHLVFKHMSCKLSFPQGTALFVEQYGVVESQGGTFADSGDSGALVVNSKNEAVGLLFAKASVGDMAVVNPIGPILTRFALTV